VLGGEWRPQQSAKERNFGIVPFGPGERRQAVQHTVWYNSKLRPSTALLMLDMAGVQQGDTVLDPMGGVGTIAIEAAMRWPDVRALTADNNGRTTSAAIKNCRLARTLGALASGSTVHAQDCDARTLSTLPDGTVDKIVCDMPFNNRTDWDASKQLPGVLAELGRVLRPTSRSRCVLLMQGIRRVQRLFAAEDAHRQFHGLRISETHTVGIGGFVAYVVVLEKVAAAETPPSPIALMPEPNDCRLALSPVTQPTMSLDAPVADTASTPL